MKETSLERISKQLIPDRREYFNSTELVDACEKIGIPMSRKTLYNHIKDGILPKAIHSGHEALFHREYVMDEIRAIHILKSVFHVKYDELKKLATNKYSDFQSVVPEVYGMLSHIQDNSVGKRQKMPFLVNIANNPTMVRLAKLLLEEIKEGKNIAKMDLGKFIIDSLDKV